MNQATMLAEEGNERPIEKLHVKIGGMQCSFCVASIDQALTQLDGVNDADVNLAHEEVLVQYEPGRVTPTQLKGTLRSLGFTARDPRKVRSFEEEEAELRYHRNQLLTAAGVMLVSVGFMSAMWLGMRDGEEEEILVEAVHIGDQVGIRPGESIPVDGTVVEGASAVDQSLVTGESIPVEKALGDEVIGGSINRTGALLVCVTTVGEESFLQRVARFIEEARVLKPGIMQLVDQVLKGPLSTRWPEQSWSMPGSSG